jgi:hypothetical protein
VTSGDATWPIVAAAADALAWTRAPLFIAQPERAPAADPVPTARAFDAATPTSSVRDVSAIEPQSDGLFVPRSGGKTAP